MSYTYQDKSIRDMLVHRLCDFRLQLSPCLVLPFGPRTVTLSCPNPASVVSMEKWLQNVSSRPCWMPGPHTRSLLAASVVAAEWTKTANGLPVNHNWRAISSSLITPCRRYKIAYYKKVKSDYFIVRPKVGWPESWPT